MMDAENPPIDTFKLNGLAFIQSLLEWEQKRFEDPQSLNSTLNDLRAEFSTEFKPVYPCYFSGNINEREGKYVVIGINPGFSCDTLTAQPFYRERGLFEASCYVFRDYYARQQEKFMRHYSRIGGFLRKFYGLQDSIDWIWFHNNLVSLEVVPYHSENSKQLRINNPSKFRDFYLEALLKIIRYLEPTTPIIISGVQHVHFFLRKECEQIFNLVKHERNASKGAQKRYSFYTGVMDKKYSLVVVPFLTQPPVPIDELVEQIRSV
jgi:hypothetical protein